jgi:hypothetical protein
VFLPTTEKHGFNKAIRCPFLVVSVFNKTIVPALPYKEMNFIYSSNKLMKFRFCMAFLVTVFFQTATAQKVFIRGEEGLRPLTWSDFTGAPDDSSPFFANTAWVSSFKFNSVRFNGEAALPEGFEFTLQLDPQGSWVKKGKQTDDLLRHEQGHFNIGLLYMREAVNKIGAAAFTRSGYQAEIKTMLGEVHKKYVQMGEQYDKETAHSINKEAQQKWDAFFSKELN